jgi:hypothetical protein
MKLYSIAATDVSIASICPVAQMTASFMPVAAMLASRRFRYGLVSTNRSGSVDCSSVSYSCHSPSNSVRRRSAAPRRKWWAHFGQTLSVAARSLL